MATLTIRKLDETVKHRLRIQAAQHNISMEEEARRILRQFFIPGEQTVKLGTRIHTHFSEAGCQDENFIPPRSTPRAALDFTDERDGE